MSIEQMLRDSRLRTLREEFKDQDIDSTVEKNLRKSFLTLGNISTA